MAVKAKENKEQQDGKRGLTETQRWVAGVVLFTFAVYLLVAVVSYYFCWADDQNFVRWGDMWRADAGAVVNPAGKTGAVLANYVIGEWFGAFGLGVPVVMIILALRIINYRPAVLRRSVRTTLIVMLLGSLSLGFVFGRNWGVFGSGLGGEHGVVMSEWLISLIGVIGTGLALLLGWILIGLYINKRRTINIVNKAAKGIYDGGAKIGGAVTGQVTDIVEKKKQKREEEQELEEELEKRYAERVAALEKAAPMSEIVVEDIVREEPAVATADDDMEVVFARDEEEVYSVGGDSVTTAAQEEEYSVGGVAPASEGAKEYTTVNEMYATRGPKVEQDGVFTVIDTREEEPEAVTEPAVAEEPKVVALGEEAGNFIIGRREQETAAADNRDGVYVLGEEPARPAYTPSTYSQSGNHSGGLEVVDMSGGSSAPISAGGVVEASSAEGVKPEDKLEVIVAGHNDAQLADEEIDEALYDPTKELSKYQKPPVDVLEDHKVEVQVTETEILENKNQIVRTLENFGIRIDKIKATIGPTVTLYEIVPAAGVKISKIKNLEDDIALSLKALGIRIIAPMPGKGTVGIEVPNKDKEIVSMYSVVKTKKFQESDYELPVVLGKTISNETFVIDLAKMPHLLVAGATGQGKSVGLNAIITSLLYQKHPAELKFVLVDPKRVELSLYSKLEKHFLAKMEGEDEAIITDTQKVVHTLNSLCMEMTERYELLRMAEVKKLSEYNAKFVSRRLNPNKGHRFMPYIVVVIDEFADMIMTAGREVEAPITRLAQLARAVGIHLVIATQRPDVKVITGLIKANFPARIAFRVMSMIDSRTIIDQPGANQLIGRGDMLMSLNGEVTRVQCAFIDTPEIERITQFIHDQRGYDDAYELPAFAPEGEAQGGKGDVGQLDPMFEEIARAVVQSQEGSTSWIQRTYSIGYNRAGRITDQLEKAGIVGRSNGSKPREVLIADVQSLEYILERLG